MASLLSYAAAFLSLVPTTIATPCANTTAIPLPVPEGPYASSITVQTLTDTSRLNPFNVTDAASPYRQLVVSYYEPYLKEDCASIGEMDYMPEAVAEWFNAADLPVPGMTTFSQLKLSGICLEPPASTPKTPLLLWTGGFYTSRLQYGAIAQAISSWGYRVVTIDHPYDASVIEFPDGTVLYSYYASDVPTDETSLFLQSIRVQDIAYVASVFGQPDEKIGFYGHSLGASSQTAVLQNDTTGTFVAGLNLDAKLQYPSGPLGLGGADSPAKTYMFIAHDNNTIASEPSWAAFWNTTNLLTPEDPRLAIEIPGTIHNSFTDLPFVVDAAGIRGVNESYFTTLIDTKSGQRELHDITSYAREFFDWTMKGNTTHPLLDGPSEEFTDVLYVKREGF
ncbi:hypothetical protein Sste5346_010246 [Sporothrix stenoceras]|uniref:1-alkyl-2-acetylglycerophosphocholine esterase n=1 Tax=Sporothrix stenoceras TaxID=5173 RepID=A0ABR3YHA6_9PEZI